MDGLESMIAQDATNGVQSLLGGAIGQGVGDILGTSQQDQMNAQYAQQQRLGQLQVQNSETLMGYQNAMQLEMWKDTNAPAQVAEYEAAGLNPALMYKGSGGQPMMGGGMPTAQGGNAADSAQLMQAQNQQNMTESQMAVMNSQANLNNAQAQKIKGVDTEAQQANIGLTTQEIQKVGQDISLEKAQQVKTEADAELTNFNTIYAKATAEDQAKLLSEQVNTQYQIMLKTQKEAEITTNTENSMISLARTNALNAVLQGEAIKVGIQVDKQNIWKMSQDVANKITELDNQKMDINQKLTIANAYMVNALKVAGLQAIGNMANTAVGGLMKKPSNTNINTEIKGDQYNTKTNYTEQ